MRNRMDLKLIWSGVAVVVFSVLWRIAGPYLLAAADPYAMDMWDGGPAFTYSLESVVASVLSAPVGATMIVGGLVIKALRPLTPVTCSEAVPRHLEP